MEMKSLRGRKVVDRVRSKGDKWRGKHMNALYTRKKGADKLFVGTSASTKLHKSAVKRNRMRRRCKEALRLAVRNAASASSEKSKTSDTLLLLTPKSSSLSCDFAELRADAEALVSHLL